MSLRDPKGRHPLHEQARQLIQARINEGEYAPGEQLPAAQLLAQELGVSLITIRRALRDLQFGGVLRSVPGIGNFVSAKARFVRRLDVGHDPLYGTFDAAEQVGSKVSTEFIGIELSNPEIDEFRIFEISRTNHFCVKKIIKVDGEPISFDVTYITYPAERSLIDEFGKDFIYRALRKNDIAVRQTNMFFDAAPATSEVARHLGIADGFATIRHFYNPVLRDRSMRIYGVSISPCNRIGFSITSATPNSTRGDA